MTTHDPHPQLGKFVLDYHYKQGRAGLFDYFYLGGLILILAVIGFVFIAVVGPSFDLRRALIYTSATLLLIALALGWLYLLGRFQQWQARARPVCIYEDGLVVTTNNGETVLAWHDISMVVLTREWTQQLRLVCDDGYVITIPRRALFNFREVHDLLRQHVGEP